MRDLKYLIAYLVPASAAWGLYAHGIYSWSTPLLVFGFLPLLELFTPKSTENTAESAEEGRSGRVFFDWLLYLNAPILFGIVGWYLWTLSIQTLSFSEILGLSLSAGIVVGTCGINVAHELGHRARHSEQILSQIMLLPALYQHFFIEHNRGHHKHVATDKDPATARFGENLYHFWKRSVFGGWQNAWALEADRLTKMGKPVYSWSNAMLRYLLFQSVWILGIWRILGLESCLGAISIAMIGFLLLETVNYIEHYGLRRNMMSTGHPEPVSPRHSWNSDHELGRIFLYELTRHSDHHYKSTRKYQVLRHMDESPQLPFGYPTSIVLALVPPIWFRIMHQNPGLSIYFC